MALGSSEEITVAVVSRNIRTMRQFWHDDEGAIIVETALIMPFLVLLLLGMLDMGLAMMAQHKVTKSANLLANTLTSESSMSNAIITDRMLIVSNAMTPFNDNNRLRVIISSLTGQGGTVKNNWQIGSGGLTGQSSRFGSVGGTINVPNSSNIRNGDNSLGIEVFYDHEWLFMPDLITNDTMLSSYVLFRTRFIPMTTI